MGFKYWTYKSMTLWKIAATQWVSNAATVIPASLRFLKFVHVSNVKHAVEGDVSFPVIPCYQILLKQPKLLTNKVLWSCIFLKLKPDTANLYERQSTMTITKRKQKKTRARQTNRYLKQNKDGKFSTISCNQMHSITYCHESSIII